MSDKKIKKTNLAAAMSLVMCIPGISSAAEDKLDICHMTGNGSKIVLNVPSKAANKHLMHYDHLPITLYEDADGDGHGNAEIQMKSCEEDVYGYVESDDDLDDTNPSITNQAPPPPPSTTFAPAPPPPPPPSQTDAPAPPVSGPPPY